MAIDGKFDDDTVTPVETKIDPATARMLGYFRYEHLKPELQSISKPLGELAREMVTLLPNSAERAAGLRKLLEAKDCFVRAALPPPPPSE